MRLPLLLIFIIFLVSFVAGWLTITMLKKYNVRKAVINVYSIAALLLFIALIVIISLPRRSSESGINFVMWGLYVYVALLISEVVGIIAGYIGLIPALRKKNRKSLNGIWCAGATSLIVFSVFMYGSMVTRHRIDVEEVEFVSDKIPADFNNFRIVQFSDAHLGTWGNDTTFISSMVDTINALKPDVIIFSGDIVNRKSDELIPFVKTLSRLKAKYGVYSVLGNHDYGDYISWNSEAEKVANLKELKDLQRQMNWKLLNDSLVVLRQQRDSVLLVGVENWGEPPFHCYGNLEKAFASSTDSTINANDSNFKILISHNPEHWNQIVSKQSNIDLTLSGHTHAMQCMLKIGKYKVSPAGLKYPQWGGLYSRRNKAGEETSLYVNIGVGEVAIPARLGATPELTLIILKNPRCNRTK